MQSKLFLIKVNNLDFFLQKILLSGLFSCWTMMTKMVQLEEYRGWWYICFFLFINCTGALAGRPYPVLAAISIPERDNRNYPINSYSRKTKQRTQIWYFSVQMLDNDINMLIWKFGIKSQYKLLRELTRKVDLVPFLRQASDLFGYMNLTLIFLSCASTGGKGYTCICINVFLILGSILICYNY